MEINNPAYIQFVTWEYLKVAVGAGLFKKSACVANDGMQSHCEMVAFSTTIYSRLDVTWGIISFSCTIYTTSCARILGGETCHTWY